MIEDEGGMEPRDDRGPVGRTGPRFNARAGLTEAKPVALPKWASMRHLAPATVLTVGMVGCGSSKNTTIKAQPGREGVRDESMCVWPGHWLVSSQTRSGMSTIP